MVGALGFAGIASGRALAISILLGPRQSHRGLSGCLHWSVWLRGPNGMLLLRRSIDGSCTNLNKARHTEPPR